MKVPPLLESAYQSDHKLAAFVSPALSKITAHIASNRMVFFPEYTDHGITHLELTLQTAFDLATRPAQRLLTSADTATFTVAVALHDLGMHLTRDGFESLVSPGSPWRGVEYFDSKGWPTLWEDFYAEATRFDGRKLRLLFGDGYRPPRPLPPKNFPWEDFDYLLVGEFLRRHHPRLAHEIALHGLPAKDGNVIAVCPTDTEDQQFLADIAGVIARSHGMELRVCLGYLDHKYQNKINPRRINAAFLGVLLRIADYFQIQAQRAPTERSDVASFQSRLSEREWSVHQSVKDIHNTGGDPEAIVVLAQPQSVSTFLRLKQWLIDLQNELDRSWAILGEIYGLQTHNDLNQLGLKIRRVKSNLDDVSSFAKTVSYVPAQISFEAANADLLKLLVAPLYGNSPGIGLRELFQNALDAVREFDDLSILHPELASVDRYTGDADVTLHIQCDNKELPTVITVTDRGIGMTADIIQNYFLKVGASFRQSNLWRRAHEDIEGHSRVLRTGRFGVGALAAFLLGDEIEVTTRYAFASKDEGVRFTAKLDDEAISLDRITCPVGTRIKIKVPERMRNQVKQLFPYQTDLSFDSPVGHYFLQRPSLSRRLSGRPPLLPKRWLPQLDDEESTDWRWFKTLQFEKVFWSHDRSFPAISCNGIVVEKPGNQMGSPERLATYLYKPAMSIFDKDGLLPINLQRTGLQASLPFEPELVLSMTDDLVAYSLVEGPSRSDSSWFYSASPRFGVRYPTSQTSDWLIGRDGFVLNHPDLLARLNCRYLVVVKGGIGYEDWGETIRASLPHDALMVSFGRHNLDRTRQKLKGQFKDSVQGRFFDLPGGQIRKMVCYIPTVLLKIIGTLKPGRAVQRDLAALENAEAAGDWRYICRGSSPPLFLSEALTSLAVKPGSPAIVNVFELEPRAAGNSTDLICQRWIELLGTPVIPFDTELRSELEKRATPQIAKLLQAQRGSRLGKPKK